MRKIVGRCLVAASLLASASTGAVPVRFDWVGSVTDEAINGCGVVVACAAASGSFVFDSLAVDGNPAGDTGLYAATDVRVSIDGMSFFSGAGGSINVANWPSVDQYGIFAPAGLAVDGSTADLSVFFEDATHLVLTSDALPLTSGFLAAMLPGTFTLYGVDAAGADTFQLMGTIDGLSCTSGCGGVPAIPEPSTMLLMALGLIAVGGLHRKSFAATPTRRA